MKFAFRPLAAPRSSFVAACVLLAQSGYAEETTAAAQALFEQGRDLLRAGQVEEACPKLSESQRLAPATGTLLALAMCHEAQGKLASAWAEYAEVAVRAGRDAQTEREAHARAKVAELKPRLSTLEVRIPPSVAAYSELDVSRDHVAFGKAAWNTRVPVDGGQYVLRVTAAGKVPWQRVVVVAAERDDVVAEVPELATAAVAPSSGTPTRPADTAPIEPTSRLTTEPLEPDTLSSRELSGLVVAGVGVASWVVGGGSFYAAYREKLEYQKACEAPECEADSHYDSARNYGNWATGLGIGGGVLVLTGALLYFWSSDEPKAASSAPALHLDLGPRRAFLGVAGAF